MNAIPASIPTGVVSSGGHRPVMLAEVLEQLRPVDGGTYLDGTFGGGGYARAILAQANCGLLAIDRDPDAIARGEFMMRELTAAGGAGRLRMVQGSFGDMRDLLQHRGVSELDGIVLDLGVSSFQIDEAERGFSFRADGPLDMRMSQDGPSAADLVNTLPEADLADVIYQYGEERLSRRIARAIVSARAEQRFETTLQLAAVIRRVVPQEKSGIDPATRSFQALRIRVNDELGQIETGLQQASRLLRDGGRLVVVSFHSLEDRIVKRFMADAAGRAPSPSRHDPRAQMPAGTPAMFRLVTGKALRPGEAETRQNPRARSAKLRTLERLPDTTRSPGEAR